MAERLLNNLITAVTNLRDNPEGNNRVSSGHNGSVQPATTSTISETTNEALHRLYPSINQPPVVGNASNATVTQLATTDRSFVNALTRFDPNTNYRPKKGKKHPARQNKRKHSESTRSSKATLKDVVLLPSPKINVVPRGKNREELYTKCFAESAVEISDDMSEQTIKEKFATIFQRKLNSLPEPKFDFVRAIGNKIIPVPVGPFTGKLLKYIAKQGAIYIRAKSDVDKNWRSWFKEVIEDNQIQLSSDESDDNELPCPFGTGIQSNTANSCATRDTKSSSTNSHANTANGFPTRDTVSSPPAPIISCPTCYNFFSADTIQEHADLCAEEADGIPATRRRYVDLLGEDDQCLEVINESTSDGNQTAEDYEDLTKYDIDESNDTNNAKERLSEKVFEVV